MTTERGQRADLERVAEELYGQPLREFIDHRTAAARALDKPLAASVRALRKPSPAAWLVDQLVRSDAAGIEAAIALGLHLQQAQADGEGDRIRDLSRQHRDEVRRLTDSARTIAVSAGLTASAAVLDEVAQTISAAMSDAGAAAAVRSGLLVRSLRSTGFEAVDLTDTLAVCGVAAPESVASASIAAPASTAGVARPSSRTPEKRAAQKSAAQKPADQKPAAQKRADQKRERLAEERRRRELDRQRTTLAQQRDQAEADAVRLAQELDALEQARQEKTAALSEAQEQIAELNDRLDAL
ncbi:MAG: hypothetical protein ABWX98_02585 [Lacisediminihabitans sp.]